MKSLFRMLSLWGVLVLFSWLMANAERNETLQVIATVGLFALPPLAVWLTARAAAALTGPWYGRVAFWTVTVSGWFAALLVVQNRFESPAPEHRANLSSRSASSRSRSCGARLKCGRCHRGGCLAS